MPYMHKTLDVIHREGSNMDWVPVNSKPCMGNEGTGGKKGVGRGEG